MHFHCLDAAQGMAGDHWLMCVRSLELFPRRSFTTTHPYILPETIETYRNVCECRWPRSQYSGWNTATWESAKGDSPEVLQILEPPTLIAMRKHLFSSGFVAIRGLSLLPYQTLFGLSEINLDRSAPLRFAKSSFQRKSLISIGFKAIC